MISIYYPKFSVVTVVRNAENSIEQTVQSVLSQDYPNVEYIVVDGQSTDQTLTILKSFEKRIDFLISEPDNGIFDAMNKGASLASGTWIIYMNSGDYFYEKNSISKLTQLLNSDADVIFAGAEKILIDELETRHFHVYPGNVDQIWRHMPTVHQSTIVRLSVQRQYGFNIDYQWCADHDMLARLYQDGKKFVSSTTLFCYFDCSGGQKRDPLLFIRERWRLSQGLVPLPSRLIFYGSEFFHCTVWGRFVTMIKQFIPKQALLNLRRMRNTHGVGSSSL